MMSSFALVDSFFEKDVLCDSDKQLGPSRQGRISRYTRPQSLEEAARKDFFISKQFGEAGQIKQANQEPQDGRLDETLLLRYLTCVRNQAYWRKICYIEIIFHKDYINILKTDYTDYALV